MWILKDICYTALFSADKSTIMPLNTQNNTTRNNTDTHPCFKRLRLPKRWEILRFLSFHLSRCWTSISVRSWLYPFPLILIHYLRI